MDAGRRKLVQVSAALGAGLAAGAGGLVLPRSAAGQENAVAQDSAASQAGEPSNAEGPVQAVNIESLEEQARRVLSPGRFAFMGPAGDGWTYRENRRAFNDFPLMPGRLRGVPGGAIDLRVQLLGHELALPVFTAPSGAQRMIHARAELASAAGTGMAQTLFVASGASSRPMEEIARASAGPKWFQIYMNKDPGINRWLVERARSAGFTAIVLTADALGPGASDAFIALGRPLIGAMIPGNHDPALGGRGTFSNQKRDLSFDDIGFLREASGLPVVVKGLLRTDDIRNAIRAGASAVWVSNHGGRQMDGSPATISVLRAAVDEAGGRVPVVMDGGVRRGIDVMKALAIGATAVAVGRPILWGMALGGAAGVNSVYGQLVREMQAAMLLSGCARVGELTRDMVRLPGPA